MSHLGTEETLVEIPAIKYLENILGYHYIHGDNLKPSSGERESFRDVILIKRLENSLKNLNPWMNDSSVKTAVKHITNPESLGISLLEINEKLHQSIVDLSFTVKQSVNGQNKDQTVEFIDFNDVENNEFLVVNQFEVQGVNKTCFPDLVIFINGIPVIVIECKSPFKEGQENVKVGKKDAYEQLRRYMNLRGALINEGIEKLFYTNFFTGIFNKYHAYTGTISAEYDYYLEWKDPYPFKKSDIEDVENNGQNIFIQGLLDKNNLLKIMEFFILYETEDDIRIKKLARYQQYRAIMKAIKGIINGKTPLEKGGVIWHTQGSGKSLSMVMLARMIRRINELKDSTLVVITDRIDLDKQIYNTFARVFPSDYTKAESNLDKILTRAETVEEMTTLLSQAQAKIIMTTIQKFQTGTDDNFVLEDEEQKESTKLFFDKQIEVLTNKSNVIVFTDEAHRSQYSNLAVNMRKALPNATFIGFTGTPIEKDDKNTYKTFGILIDQYTLVEAVEDGATVAIIYEGRRQDLHIITEKLEEEFNEYFKNKSDKAKEAIKAKFINRLAMAEADERIEDIAVDMLNHYKENIYPNGFKAQIVCVSRNACVKYYNAIKKHMKEIIGEELEAKVIFSCDNNEAPHLVEHRTTKKDQDELLKRFKQPISKDKLCFIIVKDMLLTGFDAKIEQVMYLDRPLKEHTLLQAIARVNRTYTKEIEETDEDGNKVKSLKTKNYGFVVDYFGITRHLEEALQIFNNSDLGNPMEDINTLYNKMQDYREAVMRIFTGVDKSKIDNIMNVLKPENKRAEFELAYKRYSSAVDALMPTHVKQEDLNDLKWLSYVRAGAKARFEPDTVIDISDCGEKARKLISQHLKSQGVYQWILPITLFDKDFKEKMNSLKTDEAIASGMEHAIKFAISVKMKDNPVHYTSLLERLQQILEDTKLNWEERKKQLQEFIEKELEHGEENESEKLGFDEKRQFAIFETIKSNLTSDSVEFLNDGTIKNITYDVVNTIKRNRVKGFETNPTRLAELETSIYEMLLTNYYSEIGYEKITQITNPLIELAKVHYKVNDEG